MEEAGTWRELLGTIISDNRERQRIADALGINPITLTRWSTGKSNPRLDNLRPLLDTLPYHRAELSQLIIDEFPDFVLRPVTIETSIQTIPANFYAQIMNIYTTSPLQTRAATIRQTILQHMIEKLDPQQYGMGIMIVQCNPPDNDQKVRSLRQANSRGNHPWFQTFEKQGIFFGVESQIGNAVATSHPIIIQNEEGRKRHFPAHSQEQDASSIAIPILIADQVAGCLYVVSTQSEYFTQSRLDLLRCYTDLLTLGFEPQDFYNLSSIKLGIMPDYEKQQPLIASFQQRITNHIIQASQRALPTNRLDIERQVWQELEKEMLQTVYLEQ